MGSIAERFRLAVDAWHLIFCLTFQSIYTPAVVVKKLFQQAILSFEQALIEVDSVFVDIS